MTSLLHIAVPCPLRQAFDYLSKEPASCIQPGKRVVISFRNKTCIGFILSAEEVCKNTETSKLKWIDKILDDESLIPEELMQTILWVSQYYHHPVGECFQAALPKHLRLEESALVETEIYWNLNAQAIAGNLGKKQQQCMDLLADYPDGLAQSVIRNHLGSVTVSLNALFDKGLIVKQTRPKLPVAAMKLDSAPVLNKEQQQAVEQIWQQHDSFKSFLLQGITGSGKTEIYIQLTEKMLAQGKQVLILIPEIGLTSQLVERFKQRIDGVIVVLNSSVSGKQRKQRWLLARCNQAQVVIGTRSAVFTPLFRPGLIILDEEHDSSFKQQDGLKYHARQIALVRAKKMAVPIVLGSATPSLESLYQVQQQRCKLIRLNQRAGGAVMPRVHLINSSQQQNEHGLSQQLLTAMQHHLDAGNQVILFINRRGYAPVLMCHDCGWQATCQHCDARMVVHKQRNILFCHHCGYFMKLIELCPGCNNPDLKSYGAGTEKIEQHLQQIFTNTPVFRIDRDSTQKINAFNDFFSKIKQERACILVGTQILAKGHDFHHVTLVGVVDADQGLYSADFRATENLAQLVTQVTGRAGRGNKAGEVLIQTEQPQHTFWQTLLKQGYQATSKALLEQRIELAMPPVSNWAVLRAESKERDMAQCFLQEVLTLLQAPALPVNIFGPVAALMEKKAGRYRAQLLLTSEKRRYLHQLLDWSLAAISQLKSARKVRWSVDIDPVDLV